MQFFKNKNKNGMSDLFEKKSESKIAENMGSKFFIGVGSGIFFHAFFHWIFNFHP